MVSASGNESLCFTVHGCAETMKILGDFDANPDTFDISSLTKDRLHIQAMTINELLAQRKNLLPKAKMLHQKVGEALCALGKDRPPQIIYASSMTAIGLIKAHVLAWKMLMDEVEQLRGGGKA